MDWLTVRNGDELIQIPVAEGLPARSRHMWATVRVLVGWVFLWAFVDKLFALGFPTGRLADGTVERFGSAAWIHGGDLSFEFLPSGSQGALLSAFERLDGTTWAEWLFMVGLAGIGIALVTGLAVRFAAVCGVAMLGLIFLATYPPPNNPLIDEHVILAVLLVGLAQSDAGDTWGLGRWWRRTGVVRRLRFLR